MFNPRRDEITFGRKTKNKSIWAHGGVATVKVTFLSGIAFWNEINLNIPRWFLLMLAWIVATLHVCLSLSQVVYNGKELNHPFGISHYRNYIFWTEYMNASVFQLELSTGDITPLRSERPPLFGLRVYDAQSQQGELISMCSAFIID